MNKQQSARALLACAVLGPVALAQSDPRLSTDPTASRAATPAEVMRLSGNSLLRASLASQNDPGQAGLSSVSFFAVPEPEPRVIKKHDLVTIIVREESEFSSEGKTETSKEASIDAGIEQFMALDLERLRLSGDAITDSPPRIQADGTREFNGEGAVERSDSFVTRVQAQVIDVKPNGTIVLEARKEIQTDEEIQRLVLSGTCRAEDVTADNTVLSTQLHDLNVHKTHEGNVRNAGKKGWIPKLLDVINPF